MKQRDKMRELHKKFRGNESRVIEEYAKAEHRGEVSRASNTNNLASFEYAERLLADGLAKGWINK